MRILGAWNAFADFQKRLRFEGGSLLLFDCQNIKNFLVFTNVRPSKRPQKSFDWLITRGLNSVCAEGKATCNSCAKYFSRIRPFL